MRLNPNLCARIVNSQRVFCSQDTRVKCRFILDFVKNSCFHKAESQNFLDPVLAKPES